MRKWLFCFLVFPLLFSQNSLWAKGKISGKPLSGYVIVYDPEYEDEEGVELAEQVRKIFLESSGSALQILSKSSFKGGPSIQLVHTKVMDTFEYSLKVKGGTVTLDGGGCWAMEKAARVLSEKLKVSDVASGFSLKGTVDKEVLFPRMEGVNLRILDDNIWDYSSAESPQLWKDAGLDCTDDYRAPRFAQLVRAYMPDVVCLQEYNRHMHDRFYPIIQEYGYAITHEGDADAWNNTPIFYNQEQLELLESNYNLYMPLEWSNAKSKSFTSAVFRQKSTGKIFGVVSTHLWWKSETAQPGSILARASQVRLVMAEVEVLKAKYGCPFFVMGDLNSEENTMPIRQLLEGGYQPCYKVATVRSNFDNGHHECGPAVIGTRKSNRKSAERQIGAIDHLMIYNAQGTEVKVFDCIQTAFTVPMTDHYPNLIDARL